MTGYSGGCLSDELVQRFVVMDLDDYDHHAADLHQKSCTPCGQKVASEQQRLARERQTRGFAAHDYEC